MLPLYLQLHTILFSIVHYKAYLGASIGINGIIGPLYLFPPTQSYLNLYFYLSFLFFFFFLAFYVIFYSFMLSFSYTFMTYPGVSSKQKKIGNGQEISFSIMYNQQAAWELINITRYNV